MKASDRAYEELRRDIVGGRLGAGAPLLEVELGERLGLSRTPVREAIARLVADGLATQQAGRTAVTEFSGDAVDQIFALRQALEVLAARTAAGAADVGAFAELAERFEAAGPGAGRQPEAYYTLTAELDRLIDAAVANPYLTQALRQLRLHLDRLRRLSRDDPQRLAASAGEHAAIARAIAARDAEVAAAATVIHLHHAHTTIKDHVRRATVPDSQQAAPAGAGPRRGRA